MPDQNNVLENILAEPPIQDRLVRLVRESYNVPLAERTAQWAHVWTSLSETKLLEKRTQRNYGTTLASDEITPAAYLLLYYIDLEKVRLQTLQEMLARNEGANS